MSTANDGFFFSSVTRSLIHLSDKTVNQKMEEVEIVCRVETPSKFNFSWIFEEKRGRENNGQQYPVVKVGEADDCKDKTGPYQLRFQPYTLVVCKMDFLKHQGGYKCIVENNVDNIKESKSMQLTIQGWFFNLFFLKASRGLYSYC